MNKEKEIRREKVKESRDRFILFIKQQQEALDKGNFESTFFSEVDMSFLQEERQKLIQMSEIIEIPNTAIIESFIRAKANKLDKIGEEISQKFSFKEIYHAYKNESTNYEIYGFIYTNYIDFIRDIDGILARAYRYANRKNFRC